MLPWTVKKDDLLKEFVGYCRERQRAEEIRAASAELDMFEKHAAREAALCFETTADFWQDVRVVD